MSSSSSRPALAVVPVSVTAHGQLDAILRCLVSLRCSLPNAPLVVAAGGESDPDLLEQVSAAAQALDGELLCGTGRITEAVNVALGAARDGGVDAVLVAQDCELSQPGWLERLQARQDTRGRPAAVVGGLVLYSDGIVHDAGLYFSLLFREWLPRLRFAPAELSAVLAPTSCPVAPSLQLLRAETLATVGLYDPELALEHGAVDYCLRTFAADLECIFEPSSTAVRLTPPSFDGPAPDEALATSFLALRRKHARVDFSPFIPAVL